MGIKNVTPYLFFNGQATDAVALYERALGARTESLMRFGELPGGCTAGDEGRVMHASLRLGEALVMVSDAPTAQPSAVGANVQLTLDFDDLDDMRARFDALAATGAVVSAIQETFWGAHFGVLRDSFGVFWMFNCQKAA
ncbi:MAG: glyoxalase/bleomycin resistance/extradiol dioxygenase family protein [Deltaproteobacteria bacterium]|nr:MAG: glyoxalase/bleomycin resistance/extradiol dioxygenase family protein [Deltaproteobacteria bacterium]